MRAIVLIAFIILFPVRIDSQWINQESGVSVNLKTINFFDTLVGYIIADSAVILTTKDGGKIWTSLTNPNGERSFNDIATLSVEKAIIIGDNGFVLLTRNGGLDWEESKLSDELDLQTIFMLDENEGWITGYKIFSTYAKSNIYYTNNGGDSWEIKYEYISNAQFDAKLFTGITFENSNIGWFIAGDYFDNLSPVSIYKTMDGGLSWAEISTLLVPQTEIKYAGEDILWSSGMFLFYSTDKGMTWESCNEDPSLSYRISQPILESGWSLYYDFASKTRKILFTTDLGCSWKSDYEVTDFFPSDIVSKDGFVWVIGSAGNIIQLNTLLSVGVDNNNEFLETFTVFPNPFNSTTTLVYNLLEVSDIIISIYTINGEFIYNLRLNSQQPGTYYKVWNADNYSSGIYIARLNVSGIQRKENISKKLILIK